MDRIPLFAETEFTEADRKAGRVPFVADYLAYLLARASHLISVHFHAHLARRGVPVSSWRVLGSLAQYEGLTVGELARLVLFKQPTLTKVLDRLQSQGLVVRQPQAEDRRKVGLFLTAAGRALVDELIDEARRCENRVLGQCTDTTGIEPLKESLRRLIGDLETGVAPPPDPPG